MALAAPRNVSATRSGPGLLVAWSAVAGAEAYVVSRARKHSLSFFPLETGCCPTRYEDLAVPCCPVASSSTSLQVEGLEPGMTYRFRVLAVGAVSNASSAPSEPVVAPALPGGFGRLGPAPVCVPAVHTRACSCLSSASSIWTTSAQVRCRRCLSSSTVRSRRRMLGWPARRLS